MSRELERHVQSPCPYCRGGDIDCTVCGGKDKVIWKWEHTEDESGAECDMCGEEKPLMELQDASEAVFLYCKQCMINEHEERCGCDKWDE